MSDAGKKKSRRSYRPVVEALEALRLFSGDAAALPFLADLPSLTAGPAAVEVHSAGRDTWDVALGDSGLSDVLGPSRATSAPKAVGVADADAIQGGMDQLDRYLSRAWYRAGLTPQQHEDSTQAVYVLLLQSLGRDRFDRLLSEIGRQGIPQVLSRETAEGPDFFRAVDAVKKRAQRERSYQPLDQAADVAASQTVGRSSQWRDALQEAIDQSLNPRETALIQATLQGETPSEIALHWGIAPKTVSNEKTRALQKLREFLVAELPD